MKCMIVPLTKNPTCGRSGDEKRQDWYRQCKFVTELEKVFLSEGHEVEVLLVTDVQCAGCPHESSYYLRALEENRVCNMVYLRQGFETMGQITIALERARERGATPIFVSTFGHYLRVAWLLRNTEAGHRIVFGLPRWRELFTDAILTFLFPLIDICGGREWFRRRVFMSRVYASR